eukprot:sb/3472849/
MSLLELDLVKQYCNESRPESSEPHDQSRPESSETKYESQESETEKPSANDESKRDSDSKDSLLDRNEEPNTFKRRPLMRRAISDNLDHLKRVLQKRQFGPSDLFSALSQIVCHPARMRQLDESFQEKRREEYKWSFQSFSLKFAGPLACCFAKGVIHDLG